MEITWIIEWVLIIYLLWSNHSIKKALVALSRSITNMADLADNELNGIKFRIGDLESEINNNEEDDDE